MTATDESLAKEILQGLSLPQKRLPSKFLYDERGSALFERICELPEYYLTRTEYGILESNLQEIVGAIPSRSALFEFGSGSSLKTRLLLKKLNGRNDSVTYFPIDISREALRQAVQLLSRELPNLKVIPICADFTQQISEPSSLNEDCPGGRVLLFQGSTIGNFDPSAASKLLESVAGLLGERGRVLIGVDLVKDRGVLEAAYDDSQQVTAAFNLNLLRRLNEELDADFELAGFKHGAFFNSDEGRIEMHIRSMRDQSVKVRGTTFQFREGETIHTENSYKYTPDRFETLARGAGFKVSRYWTDVRGYFAVYLLKCG